MEGPTTDHEEIRRWAEANRAFPVEVLPYKFNAEPSILRFIFNGPAEGTKELRPISWESFFATFDLLGLAFVFSPTDPIYEILQIEEKSAYTIETHP